MTIKITKADLRNPIHTKALITLLDTYAKGPIGGSQGLSTFVKGNLAIELSKRDNIIVLLAFNGATPVGLLNAIEGFSTFTCKPVMNIHDVAVLAEYRRQGISRLLFEEIERYARLQGCYKMTLEVLDNNTIAKSAYTQFGYTNPLSASIPPTTKTLFWVKSL